MGLIEVGESEGFEGVQLGRKVGLTVGIRVGILDDEYVGEVDNLEGVAVEGERVGIVVGTEVSRTDGLIDVC